jgi:LacI family sucrose operon transcriptional repressor
MSVSVRKIAELSGESVTTVRAVLHGTGFVSSISETRRARIKRIAQEHGFQPGMQSQLLNLRKSAVIGVIVPEVGIPFFGSLVGALEHEVYARNYQLLICSSRDDPAIEQDLVNSLMTRQLDGLIIATASQSSPRGIDVPVVFVDRDLPGDDHLAVISDHEGGASAAMRHLIATGGKRIGLLGGIEGISTCDVRRDAYLAELESAGLPVDPNLQVEGAHDRESAKAATLELLEKCGELPDAIFVVAYYLFEGMLDALVEKYGSIPESLRLATFDDHPLVDYLPVPVTSVRQDTDALAHTAAEMLFDTIQGRLPGTNRQVIPVQVISRD